MTTPGFPLPLTPFERYMVLDDRPTYPMTLVGQVDFDGVFQRAPFEAAVLRALERQPMLRTTVHGHREWRQPRPAAAVDVIRWVPWSDETPREAFKPIDISREIGIRFFVQQNSERTRWSVEAHHAAADGRSVARFLWDIIAAYAAECSGTGGEPAWSPSDPALLQRRGESRRVDPVATPLEQNVSVTPPISEVVGFLFRRPARIKARRVTSHGGGAPPVVDHTFDALAFDLIRRAARKHGASVNDVFLCALMQTLAEWNAPAAPYRGGQWLRIMVPTEMRRRDDMEIGATNLIGFAFLDRRARDCGDAGVLLASIRDEMQYVRVNRVGQRILDGIAMVDRIPGLLRLILRPRVTMATAVFSNNGRVAVRIPGVLGRGPDNFSASVPSVQRVRAMVPLRPGTRAGFTLSRLRNTLTLTLRCDQRYLDHQAAEELLKAFVGKVTAIAQNGTTTDTD